MHERSPRISFSRVLCVCITLTLPWLYFKMALARMRQDGFSLCCVQARPLLTFAWCAARVFCREHEIWSTEYGIRVKTASGGSGGARPHFSSQRRRQHAVLLIFFCRVFPSGCLWLCRSFTSAVSSLRACPQGRMLCGCAHGFPGSKEGRHRDGACEKKTSGWRMPAAVTHERRRARSVSLCHRIPNILR